MKKIIVAMAVAVSALALNAASTNWTLTNIYSSTDSSAKASGYSAMLFLTSNSSNVSGLTLTTLEAVVNAIGTDGWVTTLTGLASAQGNLNAYGGIVASPTGISTDFNSGSLSAFAIVFDASTVADASHYYLVSGGSEKSVTFTSPTGAKTFSFGSQATDSADASNWKAVAVPEPTSGLLLLLGMAGLAIKRKRA